MREILYTEQPVIAGLRGGRQAAECFPVTSSPRSFSHEKETPNNKRCSRKVLSDKNLVEIKRGQKFKREGGAAK